MVRAPVQPSIVDKAVVPYGVSLAGCRVALLKPAYGKLCYVCVSPYLGCTEALDRNSSKVGCKLLYGW